ncbi:MAG: hypothetical protein ABSG58_05305 [Acidimicrobiales bacterium]
MGAVVVVVTGTVVVVVVAGGAVVVVVGEELVVVRCEGDVLVVVDVDVAGDVVVVVLDVDVVVGGVTMRLAGLAVVAKNPTKPADERLEMTKTPRVARRTRANRRSRCWGVRGDIVIKVDQSSLTVNHEATMNETSLTVNC